MAITNGYCDLPQLKSHLKIDQSDTADDDELERAVETASRDIDSHCRYPKGIGFFDYDGTAQALVFAAESGYRLSVYPFHTTTGLVVKTDTSGDGTFDTTWASTDFQAEPVNAITLGETAHTLRAVASRWFPVSCEARVQVTARWGWSATPTDVEQACLFQAARVFMGRYSPAGFAELDSGAAAFDSSKLDPKAAAKLRDYVLVVV